MSNNDNKNLKNEENNKTPESITKNLFNKAFQEIDTYDTKEVDTSKNYKKILKKYTENLIDENDIEEQDEVYFEDEYFVEEDDEDDDLYSEQNPPANNKYRKKIDKYGKDFFTEEYNENDTEKGSLLKFVNFLLIIGLIISTTILAINLQLSKTKLETLKEENQNLIVKNQDAENKLLQDSLKNEIEELKNKNLELQDIINGNNKPDNSNSVASNNNSIVSNSISDNSNNNDPTPNNTPQNNSTNTSFSEYTVKEKDSFWKISEAVYGNGVHYEKIIKANNLTENSKLTPGQKLKIPKIN